MERIYEVNTKKYPWLVSKYDAWDKDGNPEVREYEVLSRLPDGWLVAFGDLMCEDLDKIIRRDNLNEFRIDEAKEKWGAVRIYASGSNDETKKIIDDYSKLSENICMICGKPDVHMTGLGWYYPCCKDCWDNDSYTNGRSYEEAIVKGDTGRMATKRAIRRYKDGESEDIAYDLKDTADRIRAYWKERFGDE